MNQVVQVYNNHFAMNVDVSIWQDVNDSIIVDGKTYTNLTRKQIHTSSINWLMKEERPMIYEAEIEFFNLKYYWIDSNRLSKLFVHQYCPRRVQSTNDIVMIYTALFESGAMDKRILGVDTISKILHQNNYMIDIVGKTIWIPFFGYGFNNVCQLKISLQDFFSIENKKETLLFYNDIKDYFERKYKINIDEPIDFSNALKILKRLIEKKQLHETN